MGRREVQPLDDGGNVIRRAVLAIGSCRIGHGGWRIAARIEHHAAIAAGEKPHLQFPGTRIAREFMDENHGGAAAGFLIEQVNTVIGSQKGHGIILLGVVIGSRMGAA